MLRRLDEWADHIEEQNGTVQNWDGTELPMRNIIARFNPDATKRIMLSAHWDTRPVADEDDERQDEPIPGANDGGSGVAVLMELARQLSANPLGYGVDLVFFDVEDGGKTEVPDSYCLGSQEWAKRAKADGYQAEYGILLDMVGARGAYFYREGISMHFAPSVVAKVWKRSRQAGQAVLVCLQRSALSTLNRRPPLRQPHRRHPHHRHHPIRPGQQARLWGFLAHP